MTAGHEYWNELGALNAAGVLANSEAAAWAKHLLTCGQCRADALEWEETAGALAYAVPRATPPAGLRARLLSSLDIDNPAGRKVIRAEPGGHAWQPAGVPGVDFRLLMHEAATGNQTLLVRLAPGASYAPHRHAGNEHCYVLEGDLVFADHSLQAGDYAVCAPGTTHSASTTRNGCLLLIVNNTGDEILTPH